MNWRIYLSGEIHSDWREQLIKGAAALKLPVEFVSPVTDHQLSDDCGAMILGSEENAFWHDQKGARLNQARNKVLMQQADIVVVRFGDKYRQWNAAFDAGIAAAMSKPLFVLHEQALNHALKEIDAAAAVVAHSTEQILQAINYTCTGNKPV